MSAIDKDREIAAKAENAPSGETFHEYGAHMIVRQPLYDALVDAVRKCKHLREMAKGYDDLHYIAEALAALDRED